MKISLEAQIEALLFWKAETLSIKQIAIILEKNTEEIKSALINLKELLKGRGITLIEWDEEVTLGTTKEVSDLIEKLNKEELAKEISKAGLEILSIILYQGPISRADIDYIRGVNSQFILRNLLVRGLIDKIENPKDQRSFLYRPTVELISYLGISKIEDIPEFELVKKDIELFRAQTHDEQIKD